MDERSIDATDGRRARQKRRGRWAGAVAVVAVATPVVLGTARPRGVEARQAPPPGAEAQDPAPLVEAQLKVARGALKIIDQTASRGAVVNSPELQVHYWSIRALSAQIYLSLAQDEPKTQDIEVYFSLSPCTPKAQRTAAFADHLARMKYWEDKYRPLADTGRLAALDFLVIRDHRLQAEAWLVREQLKSDGVPAKAP